ncbi:MAG: ribonuclease III [Thermodesulfobacteriota bacterium]
MDEMRLASLKELEERLGYSFHEIGLLDKSLTHRSFINETDSSATQSNEVLEFLGDAVLGLTVSRMLLQKFPEAREGTLSMWRSHLVKQSSLAFIATEIGLEKYLLLGKGELLNGGKSKSSILANAYEALIGAIFMDSGFHQAFEVIQGHFEPYLQTQTPSVLFNDYKSLLQIHSQQFHGSSPQYKVLKESGPDHDKRFQASVVIDGEVKGIGWGKTKKEAQQEAAQKALEELQIADRKLQIEKSEI